jgi:hypothetical protein
MQNQEVSLDKATVLTTIFTITDEVMKASPGIVAALRRPGRVPQLTDSEIVTIAVYQEIIGEPREDHFFRLHGRELRLFFPRINERSRYNRRKRSLWSIILALRCGILVMLHAVNYDIAVVDSAPVPVVGYKRDKTSSNFTDTAGYGICSSKALKYFGVKLHNLVTLTGIILDFILTSASPYDNQAVMELFEHQKGVLQEVLGDKAYNDQSLQDTVKQELGITLWAPRKDNQKPVGSKEYRKVRHRARLMVETVNAQLQEQLHLSKHYAKSTWGLFTRVAAKITAHTMGMLINQLLGRPPLALAGLAV